MLRSVTRTQTTPPPPWGVRIRQAREAQGRSIRQLALTSGVSDSYWGQVEKGRGQGGRPVKPSRATLALIADTLRLSPQERQALMAEAGYNDLSLSPPARGPYVDVTGLARRDVALLAAIADRLRPAASSPAEESPAPRQLRAVARKRPDTARPFDE